MYSTIVRSQALELLAAGWSMNATSKFLGVSRYAIRDWSAGPRYVRTSPARPTECARCAAEPSIPQAAADYAYLLGLYLGDGCISAGRKARAKGVWTLRIACCNAWPGLMDLCADAMSAVMPQSKVSRTTAPGMAFVTSHSKHWVCLFPQHGPGKKHERKIELADWQRVIVERHPKEFIRGLVHSDGCRLTNWTIRVVAGEAKRYEYPRYMFSQKSADIKRLFCDTLDQLGVEWRVMNTMNISVAKRDSVALMDTFVGPKY